MSILSLLYGLRGVCYTTCRPRGSRIEIFLGSCGNGVFVYGELAIVDRVEIWNLRRAVPSRTDDQVIRVKNRQLRDHVCLDWGACWCVVYLDVDVKILGLQSQAMSIIGQCDGVQS